ncbi:hypothetical protein COU58_02345 [Candidatus Pacearchaeota archaeon CG10_big_fil_rev_8_21_14_0_10_32_42]|nr:MAG: hypothetical protein COU58_02345 [Candidatus Pacearchaeota archaeon CG10_big_fil_rev_8_21_14_0_10_32_42]
MAKKINPRSSGKKLDSTSYYQRTRQTKHDFNYKQNIHEYDDPLMGYMDLKNVLSSIDEIKGVWDKRRIRKTLDMINEHHEKGTMGERVGRIGDYGGIGADLYKIAEHLSDAKYGNGEKQQDFFDLALKYKKSLLEKIDYREKQLKGEIPRFDWMNPNNFRQFLAVLSIGSVLAGIFFLSPNLTGNVIGNMAKSSGNIFGGVLFILGIVGAFFTLRK